MPFREWLLKMVEEKWKLIILLGLFFLMFLGHAVAIHWARPERIIEWVEGMIDAIFAAILMALKD